MCARETGGVGAASAADAATAAILRIADVSQRPPLSLVTLAGVPLIALDVIGRVVVSQTQAQIDPPQETVDARVIEVVEEGVLDDITNQPGLSGV